MLAPARRQTQPAEVIWFPKSEKDFSYTSKANHEQKQHHLLQSFTEQWGISFCCLQSCSHTSSLLTRQHFSFWPFDSHWNARKLPLLSWESICCFASKQENTLTTCLTSPAENKTKAVVLVIVTGQLTGLSTADEDGTWESTPITRQK